ncbi:squalene/phytoene synthase family protein [Puniceibacterium sp. IMCC21224]|uniref:squalene/phytoene synthase family protein n=1 Tax=Puniceibacterium sp. IMCC21224 TaxID=1618204 RepID=UPI00064DF126|nr:squalene/phytoene synthase family protein [Puniceibacterium sp. IMCC21224]KMK67586.1 phytoene/squalene synthetase [Puniceibacterium sp. IMCC21224]
MEFDDDLKACAALVQRGDPDRFAAVMAAPVAARLVLFPIYAFNVEVARAPWVTQESMIAEMRLQWWRDALDEIRAGGSVRRHEVVTLLARVIDAESAGLLASLVEARRWDIYRDPFEDAGHFQRYIDATGGSLMAVAARSLGATTATAARDLGYATGMASYLRAVPALEAKGRVPLVDGREPAVRALAIDGLERLVQANRVRSTIPAAAALAAWLAKPVLRLAMNEPQRVAQGRLHLGSVQSRLRLMWQAATGRW